MHTFVISPDPKRVVDEVGKRRCRAAGDPVVARGAQRRDDVCGTHPRPQARRAVGITSGEVLPEKILQRGVVLEGARGNRRRDARDLREREHLAAVVLIALRNPLTAARTASSGAKSSGCAASAFRRCSSFSARLPSSASSLVDR